MINTDTNFNAPINRTELEEIVTHNLQKNCGDSIRQALEGMGYINGKTFSLCIKKDQLCLIDGPKHRYTDDEYDKEYYEDYCNTYAFSFDLVSYKGSSITIKSFVNDILADYVENLSLLGLINLATHTYACPVNVMQAFVFNLFLTKSIFVWGRYRVNYTAYSNIITYILKKYPQDFIKFTLINIKHYLSIWKNNPKIIPNLIKILISFNNDKLSPEFKVLWMTLLKQVNDYSIDGKAIIANGLLTYTNVPCVADFSLFFNFADAYRKHTIAEKYAITFKVNSVNSLTQFVNDLLANLTPDGLVTIVSIVKKLVANGVQFDIDSNCNEQLDVLIKQTDVQGVSSLMLINQILKMIANQ